MEELGYTISIIIPAFNAVGQVEGLLTRLNHFKQKYGDAYQVIVTDDCSGDGTVKMVRDRFPEFEVVANQTNRGYGANVMSGVALAKNEYLAMVNTDIEFFGNPFNALVAELVADDKLFATMPLIYNRNLDKVENLARLYCHRGLCWHTELAEEDNWSAVMKQLVTRAGDVKSRLRDIAAKEPPVNSVLCGAIFVCSRERFNELGGFDPRYRPFYWEDVDLDYKARRKGWRCATVPRAAVIHRHSETIDRYHHNRKLLYLRMNQLRFVVEHQGHLEGLKAQHLWWSARAVRELFGGSLELMRMYWFAGLGGKRF